MLRPTIALLLLCAPLLAGAQSVSERLAALGEGEWLDYHVALEPGRHSPCCFDWNGKDARRGVCRLDRKNWNFGHSDDDPLPPAGAQLRVLVRKAGGGIDRVRAVGEQCALEIGNERVVDAGTLATDRSLALLEPVLAAGRESDRHHALGAIALHAGAAADAALLRAAAPGQRRDLRREAWFWLAEARGERGLQAVIGQLQREGDDELRKHLVFTLTVNDAPGAKAELRRLATTHADDEVRGEALFWLSQSKDPQAEQVILAALRRESSPQLREKAVFALSQLPAKRAIPALRALLEPGQDRELRKHALFWLAQVDDDAVLTEFDRLLGGESR